MIFKVKSPVGFGEARTLLEHQGVLFAGEDQWAVVKTNGGRDWVQASHETHEACWKMGAFTIKKDELCG